MHMRGVLEGIAQFLIERSPWAVYLPEWSRGEAVPQSLRGWRGDGMIVRAENRDIAMAVLACGLPVVDLSAAGLLSKAPAVHSDVRS